MNVTFKHRGSFKRTEKFLNFMKGNHKLNVLDKYGREGVKALAAATPKDTGHTAECWTYEIERNDQGIKISWLNTNVNEYVSIALLLQHGHATRTGGYVQGRDYINPAIQPVFDKIADKAWKEVTGA